MSKPRPRQSHKSRLLPEHFGPKGQPKRQFSSREGANEWRRERKQRDKQVYRCGVCSWWHIGSPR